MAVDVQIEWAPGSSVTGTLAGPQRGGVGILLAHGAGAGRNHPFMLGMRDRLGDAGFPTLAFDYPYMAAGRKAPDRLPTLVACHTAALAALRGITDRVVLAGKSMGGRVGGHVAAEVGGVAGLVFFGYPLVPLGKTDARDTSHLTAIDRPMLFVQGERDRLGPLEAIGARVGSLPGARLESVPEGDHSFRVPKRTGLTPGDVLDRIAGWTIGFVASL